MTDTRAPTIEDACETPMADHIARFWRLLEEGHVRILVDTFGHRTGSSFPDAVAKALVAERARTGAEGVDGAAVLRRYRYAAAWMGADAWDGCQDCVSRLQWAKGHDNNSLSENEVAAIGTEYLVETGNVSPTPPAGEAVE